ncbi:hypothetical protein BDA96_10G009500 [Sorghum bicolor]|uniref:Uncharacterized protein n=2 Tax=Sorghum bicolor TaxID=4558 RepID=A0A921PZC5_SORBI|nr:hypothetical protein BDA96_10G009500 [Sorghum bicolor]OQU75696.1 hypothetical protein SORBI_3010G008466 [Sorghum bicolor]
MAGDGQPPSPPGSRTDAVPTSASRATATPAENTSASRARRPRPALRTSSRGAVACLLHAEAETRSEAASDAPAIPYMLPTYRSAFGRRWGASSPRSARRCGGVRRSARCINIMRSRLD